MKVIRPPGELFFLAIFVQNDNLKMLVEYKCALMKTSFYLFICIILSIPSEGVVKVRFSIDFFLKINRGFPLHIASFFPACQGFPVLYRQVTFQCACQNLSELNMAPIFQI